MKKISAVELCYFFALYCIYTNIVRKTLSCTTVQLYLYQICTYLFDLTLDNLWKNIIFRHNVCKTWKYLMCCNFFYILPPWGDNNIDVQNDYNIVRSEEVYTSDHTDEFKTSQKTCLRWKYISIFSSFFYFYIHIQSRNNWWN